jgi:hypothetical protein
MRGVAANPHADEDRADSLVSSTSGRSPLSGFCKPEVTGSIPVRSIALAMRDRESLG